MERLWYAVQREPEDDWGTLLIHRIGYDEVYTTDGKAVWYD